MKNKHNNTIILIVGFLFNFVYVNAMEQNVVTAQILPDDEWKTIIMNYKADSVEKTMKEVTQLRTVSKQYAKIITDHVIGGACALHPLEEKNAALRRRLYSLAHYTEKRHKILILIYAEADVTIKSITDSSLLLKAIWQNDGDMIDILFNYGENPNRMEYYEPVFFNVGTIDIVNKFIKKGVNLHAKSEYKPNVLWSFFETTFNKDIDGLFKFYCEQNVDPALINHKGQCLLHKMTCNADKNIDLLEFLLPKIAHLVNTIDDKERTPLDIVDEDMEFWKKHGRFSFDAHVTMIALLEKHGGKRARELSQIAS
jgi:hypothetical protein